MLEQRRRQQQAENERYARLIQELVTELQAVRGSRPATEVTLSGDSLERPVGGL